MKKKIVIDGTPETLAEAVIAKLDQHSDKLNPEDAAASLDLIIAELSIRRARYADRRTHLDEQAAIKQARIDESAADHAAVRAESAPGRAATAAADAARRAAEE